MSFLSGHRFHGLRQLWRSGEGAALLAALIFCVITSILMAPNLPAEDGYGMVGVLFIYVTVFVLAAGIFKIMIRMAMRQWGKTRVGSDEAA